MALARRIKSGLPLLTKALCSDPLSTHRSTLTLTNSEILEAAAAMSRGGSYGGGQSSLGYLFGSDEKPSAAPPPRTVNPPPYGIDTVTDQKPPDGRSPTEKEKVSNNYHRAQGQNSGNFITDRPSTKVKSVPGGDSSLGYLFGDK